MLRYRQSGNLAAGLLENDILKEDLGWHDERYHRIATASPPTEETKRTCLGCKACVIDSLALGYSYDILEGIRTDAR